MKWIDEVDGEFNGSPCKIRVGYSESDYDKNLREQRVGNVVKDYGIWDRPKVGSISANDIINDSTPSLRDTIINDLIKKREMNLLYHCRYQLADIVKMINAANTTDDLNLELLKVLVSDIKKYSEKIYEMDRRSRL